MSLVERAMELITKAGSKGIRSDVISEAIGCDNVAALLAHKCDDGTLVSCKVINPSSGRQTNEYRLSMNGGAKLDSLSHIGNAPGRPAAKQDPVLKRMRESGMRGDAADKKPEPRFDGVNMDAVHRRNAASAACAIPVFNQVKVDGDAPRVRGASARRAAIEPARPTVGEQLNRAHADDLDQPAADDGSYRIGPIEQDKPVPTLAGELRQALRAMKPGDSRLILGYTRHNIGVAASRENVPAIVRPEGDGFRVWRTG